MTVKLHKILLSSCLLVAVLLLLVGTHDVRAAVYVYELPDGTKLITDKKQYNKGYTLKNTYKTTTYRNSSANKPYYATTILSLIHI